MNALAREGRAGEAQSVFEEGLHLHGVSPNRFMVGALVSAHARAGQPALALQAYSQGRTMGVAPDEVSANALIHAFGRAGQAQTAWELYAAPAKPALSAVVLLHVEVVALRYASAQSGSGLKWCVNIEQCCGLECFFAFKRHYQCDV